MTQQEGRTAPNVIMGILFWAVEEELKVFGDVNSSVNSSIRVLEFGLCWPVEEDLKVFRDVNSGMNSAAEFLLFLGLNSAISACIWWLLQDVLSPRARVTRAGSRFSCGTHLFQISRDCVQAQGLWKSALPFLFVGYYLTYFV
ncbi:hypothetical protein RchiOBHm_Chr3g0467801 [Rosa chinensis]|uniref:Uncharacterized protein n=1 Tax=Rosa chinensis TaxID=74649 RepID=A0A2P6RAC9_ROSCH|nr:hypothetical protein RchiOBHm_Chr3g0467801 [Rosa chinensis]